MPVSFPSSPFRNGGNKTIRTGSMPNIRAGTNPVLIEDDGSYYGSSSPTTQSVASTRSVRKSSFLSRKVKRAASYGGEASSSPLSGGGGGIPHSFSMPDGTSTNFGGIERTASGGLLMAATRSLTNVGGNSSRRNDLTRTMSEDTWMDPFSPSSSSTSSPPPPAPGTTIIGMSPTEIRFDREARIHREQSEREMIKNKTYWTKIDATPVPAPKPPKSPSPKQQAALRKKMEMERKKMEMERQASLKEMGKTTSFWSEYDVKNGTAAKSSSSDNTTTTTTTKEPVGGISTKEFKKREHLAKLKKKEEEMKAKKAKKEALEKEKKAMEELSKTTRFWTLVDAEMNATAQLAQEAEAIAAAKLLQQEQHRQQVMALPTMC